MSVETVIATLLSAIAIEAAIIGYMLRHYFIRIEATIVDFENRIVKLETHRLEVERQITASRRAEEDEWRP